MVRKHKNGFTLVELLAVIVILAIILVIAVPQIMKTIDESRSGAFVSSAKLIAASAEREYLARKTLGDTSFEGMSTLDCSDVVEVTEDYDVCKITFDENGKATVKLKGKGKFKGKYVCDGTRTNASVTGEMCADNEFTLNDLKERYEFKYYSSLDDVLEEINNNTIGQNQTATEDNAKAAIYTDNGEVNVVLLTDISRNEKITFTEDININLAGSTLTFNSDNGLEITSGDVVVDGSYAGSKILLTNDNQNTTLAKVSGGSLKLSYGTYETISNNVGTTANPNPSILVSAAGELVVEDAKITSRDTEDGTLAGILVENGGSAVVTDSDLELTALNGLKSATIINKGTMTVENTEVIAYSNYTANAAKTDYATSSNGILNEGVMTLKNCNVYGVHSGIRNPGTLYIDGGTYEGYGHGGIYFAGSNTTSYAKNATIQYTDIRVGYDDGIAGTNGAGMYIGGGEHITVYMDKVTLYGTLYPAVIRKSGSETNNSLYISNSSAENHSRYFRNDASATNNNKLYIGAGNNFGIIDTYLESNTVETTDDYGLVFPEY